MKCDFRFFVFVVFFFSGWEIFFVLRGRLKKNKDFFGEVVFKIFLYVDSFVRGDFFF